MTFNEWKLEHDSVRGSSGTNQSVLASIFKWVSGVAARIAGLFRIPQLDKAEDGVPDFSGVNFDRKDAAGNAVPFLWGVSTAAFQVEGGIENNDWYHFINTPSIKDRVGNLARLGNTTLRIEPIGRAVDHWDLEVLEEDLERAKLLGLNAYRFSIEWARIQPDMPAWAQTVIAKRRTARETIINANSEREAASQGHTDPNTLINHAAILESMAAGLEGEAKIAIGAPYDAGEFKVEPVLHYVEMVKAMRARGLEPILTLMHMSLPDWVLMPPQNYDLLHWGAIEDERYWNTLRGWESEATVEAFRKFVRFVIPFFKDNVKYFVTMNEPISTVMGSGYLAGVFPPGFLGAGKKALAAYHNFIEAHIAAYDEIKAIVPAEAKVGVSHWVGLARRAPQSIVQRIFTGDNEAAKSQWDYAVNQYFLDAIVLGHRNPEVQRKNKPEIEADSSNKVDFISPQFYRACDIYHSEPIALAAPWWGGQFTVDLRNSTDYEIKYLWNDLGWPIYPGGLYRLLKDIYTRYSKPILITENGMSEKQDRNRGAYTIAHLQQVLRAIKDGIDIIGYVHWSIVDNYEWAFGYQGGAHFGLFSVDRGIDPDKNKLKSFPRHITEGALAYQYLIANSRRITETNSLENPFDAPVARFGTITSAGFAVQAPNQLAGALWEGRIMGAKGRSFMLYLSRLPADQWLGMIFFQDTHQWVRLQDVTWNSEDGRNGTLMFRHPADNGKSLVQYTAATMLPGGPGTYTALDGRIKAGKTERKWTADRVVNAGMWKRASANGPSLVAINHLEGDYGKWQAKYIYGKPIWFPMGESVNWNGSDLKIEVQETANIGGFIGTLNGDTLSGSFSLRDGESGTHNATFPWEGQRLPEDIPF